MIVRILWWVFWIWVVLWIVRNPAAAGATVHHWVTSATTFMSSLAGG